MTVEPFGAAIRRFSSRNLAQLAAAVVVGALLVLAVQGPRTNRPVAELSLLVLVGVAALIWAVLTFVLEVRSRSRRLGEALPLPPGATLGVVHEGPRLPWWFLAMIPPGLLVVDLVASRPGDTLLDFPALLLAFALGQAAYELGPRQAGVRRAERQRDATLFTVGGDEPLRHGRL